ncbi:MAG: hypothetical protein ACSLFM_03970 [Tepidiformaceae bacterium]
MSVVMCGGEGSSNGDDNASFEQEIEATGETGASSGTGTSDLEPLISGGNPSIFSIIETDLGDHFTTDDDDTYVRGPQDYQAFGFFDTPDEAQARLKEWRYRGGYITGFDPVGLTASVLQGRYYINLEMHLFEGIEEARMAYQHFVDYRSSVVGVERLQLDGRGNESAAMKLLSGKVPGSEIEAVYYTYIFRRGNMVVTLETRGAEPLMADGRIAELAAIVDDKVLATRDAGEPTPVAGEATETPTP